MGLLLTLVAVWIITSIPLSLIAGRFLATRDSHPQRDVIEMMTSNGDVVTLY